MVHTGNSRAHEPMDGTFRGYKDESEKVDDPKNAEEQDLYDGGDCNYDPYFLYGFTKFGDVHTSEFDLPVDLEISSPEANWGENTAFD